MLPFPAAGASHPSSTGRGKCEAEYGWSLEKRRHLCRTHLSGTVLCTRVKGNSDKIVYFFSYYAAKESGDITVNQKFQGNFVERWTVDPTYRFAVLVGTGVYVSTL
jgi:hypothetical protein